MVNEGKTKYMLSSKKDIEQRRLGPNVTMYSYNFEVVKDFVNFGTAINTDNDKRKYNSSKSLLLWT